MPQFFRYIVPKLRLVLLTLISRSKWEHNSDATSPPAIANVFVMENLPSRGKFLKLDERGFGKDPRTRGNEDEEAL